MRLIDADALKSEFPVRPRSYWTGYEVRVLLDAAPTISCMTCVHAECNGGECEGSFYVAQRRPGAKGGDGCSAWTEVEGVL